ncbi:MAG: transcriptional regulator [Thermoproteota archaeon]|jgi:probable regulatory domain-containing protein
MSEVPLKPVGKEEIKKLELSLILGTLFRPDVLESIRSAEDKVTWLDSLIVAAGSLARERAGVPTTKIAEELGRTETTIRNHLSGRTEAGKIVKETYEKMLKGEKLELTIGTQDEKLKQENEELRQKVEELSNKLSRVRSTLEQLLNEL